MNLDVAVIGAMATGLLAFWSSVKAWLDSVLSLVWVRVPVNYPASLVLLEYFDAYYGRAWMGSAAIGAFREFVRPLNRRAWVAQRDPGEREWYFRGLAFLVVLNRKDGGNGGNALGNHLMVCHLRGLFNVEKLVVDAIASHNAAQGESAVHGSRYRVRFHSGIASRDVNQGLHGKATEPTSSNAEFERTRPLGYLPSELGAPTDSTPFAGLVYPKYVEDGVSRIRRWFGAEKFYRERRIPWRLGVLLHGAAGTGKTSLARAVGQELDMPVHVFDLSSLTNQELRSAWQECVQEAPSVALFEDIDRVFRGRDNIVEKSTLTLDMLLNCISGIEPADGVLSLVTCNDTTLLDPALGMPNTQGVSTRPGRMDLAIEFKEMTDGDKWELATQLLREQPIAADVLRIRNDNRLRTPAQVQAACAEIALAKLFSDQPRQSADAQ